MIRFQILAGLILLASGCASTRCFTPCGLMIERGDCAAVQHYEGRVTERLAGATKWTDEQICRALTGWKVRIHPHDPVVDRGCGVDAWRRENGECVLGEADVATRTIWVSTTRWAPSAFAHEVLHVASYGLTSNGDARHCLWSSGVRSALGDLNGRGDWHAPEASCSP